jgi:hypothetical protein
MRYLPLALAVLSIQPSYADAPKFDNALALGLAHVYIESYVRLHPMDHSPKLAWEQSSTDYVAFKHESYGGYVAVFVPDTAGAGYGIAYFEVVTDHPGHIFPLTWSYIASSVLSLPAAKRAFDRDAAVGAIPRASNFELQ